MRVRVRGRVAARLRGTVRVRVGVRVRVRVGVTVRVRVTAASAVRVGVRVKGSSRAPPCTASGHLLGKSDMRAMRQMALG